MIKNSDQHSKDYSIMKDKMWVMQTTLALFIIRVPMTIVAAVAFSGHSLTAPLVFAGAVAKQALAGSGIVVGAHILRS